jgi:hypothetical protein
MTNQLSPLAEKLYAKLNKYSHILPIESAAWLLSEDQSLSYSRRLAYYEVYQYCQQN